MGLSVVYVDKTLHVVGALAVTGAPATTDVASLVGTELPLRVTRDTGEVETVTLKDDELGAAAADDEPAVFTELLSFGVEKAGEQVKPTLRRLAPWSDGLKLTPTKLTVTVPENVLEDTKVFAVISGDLFIGTIKKDTKSTAFTVATTVGDKHVVLVLAPGYTGRFEDLTVEAGP